MSENLTIEERLNAQLNEANQNIAKLQQEIEDLRYQEEWKWRHIRKLSSDENLGLPVPRLEIRYRKLAEYESASAADYGLVYSHFWKNEIFFVPISSTRCGGGRTEHEDYLDLPFRDGAHIKNEMKQLNLRGFVTNGTRSREIELGEQ